MSDLIDRQAVIDLLMSKPMEMNYGFYYAARIKALPSAQLEEHTDKRTKTHSCDLISRQAAISIVEFECGEWKGLAQTIVNGIKKLQPARPERKKGHWIEADDHYNRISGRCSLCGWESHMYEDDVVGMDFCPNCGARLKGE